MQNLNPIRTSGLAKALLTFSLLSLAQGTLSATLKHNHLAAHGSLLRQPSCPEDSSPRERRHLLQKLFGKDSHDSRPAPRLTRIFGGLGQNSSTRLVRTTAYTHEEADHAAYGRSTAIGTTLRCSRTYTSAAADWSRFPLGTKFQIVGEPTIYVIDDCGGALWGTDTIDIYRPNLAAMNAWGTRHVEIKILEWAKNRSERAKNRS